MGKFAAFYLFSESQSTMAMLRLRRLRVMNPDVLFIPAVGTRQLLYLPMIVDENMFGSTGSLRLIGPVAHSINSMVLGAPGVFKLSNIINEKVVNLTGHNKQIELHYKTKQECPQTLYADYTPLLLWNLDYVIMRWFNTLGKQLDFDYLIFYEFDIFTTKPLEEIYGNYAKSYDACFVDYSEATPNWYFYNFPPKCSQVMKRWLKRRRLSTNLYRSIFSGNLLSRSVLEKLRELDQTSSAEFYCQSEMRLPTVLTNLGFKVSKLNFPFFRYRPIWSEEDICSNEKAGIFHPVKTLTSKETKQ